MNRFLSTLLLVLTAAPVLAGPGEAVAAAEAYASRLTDAEACQTRFLSGCNLSPKELPLVRRILDGWGNHLNVNPDIFHVREVQPDLWAVRIDDPGWRAKTWDAQEVEPYFYRTQWDYFAGDASYAKGWYGTPKPSRRVNASLMCALQKKTRSRAPIVRADFWLFYSSRQLNLRNKDNHGFGYLDWLQLKKRDDVDRLAVLREKDAIRLGQELRAALEQGRSGIVQLDRVIEEFQCYGEGDYWRTLDTFDNGDGNVAPAKLEPGTFKHQAEEIVFLLPGRHLGMWLGNNKGVKQNTAPDQLGGNRAAFPRFHQGNDTRIHVGLCIHCHTDGGLKDIDDWARRTLKTPKQLEEEDYQKFLRLRRQYFNPLQSRAAKFRAKYEEALQQSCGMTSGEFAAAHAWLYYRYLYLPREPGVLAVELGTSEAQLLRSLRAAFNLRTGMKPDERRRLAPLLALIPEDPKAEAQPIPITYAEQFFDDLACILQRYP